jgi:hypothetical protein
MSYYLNPTTDLPTELFQDGVYFNKQALAPVESILQKPPGKLAPPSSSGAASHHAPAPVF